MISIHMRQTQEAKRLTSPVLLGGPACLMLAVGRDGSDATYIDLQLRAVRVLDGRIIALNPLIVDELGWLQHEPLQKDSRRGAGQLTG